MGFRYRKSINLGGGFRINMSKSGIGYSWGTKGYRVTKTAKGKTRTTYSIPGTGLSYVSESGQNKSQSTKSRAQQKVHAGANRSLNRVPCEIKKVTPFYLRTNVDIIQIKLKKETFLILPDKVLIIRGSKVGAENYSDVQILASSTYFVESDRVPKDAQVVRHTWQYVNKNGTPDKRYKNNRQLPVCHYGVVTIKSDSGIDVEIQVSNIQKCKDFAILIQ